MDNGEKAWEDMGVDSDTYEKLIEMQTARPANIDYVLELKEKDDDDARIKLWAYWMDCNSFEDEWFRDACWLN